MLCWLGLSASIGLLLRRCWRTGKFLVKFASLRIVSHLLDTHCRVCHLGDASYVILGTIVLFKFLLLQIYIYFLIVIISESCISRAVYSTPIFCLLLCMFEYNVQNHGEWKLGWIEAILLGFVAVHRFFAVYPNMHFKTFKHLTHENKAIMLFRLQLQLSFALLFWWPSFVHVSLSCKFIHLWCYKLSNYFK